jgi:hypothetical protein
MENEYRVEIDMPAIEVQGLTGTALILTPFQVWPAVRGRGA